MMMRNAGRLVTVWAIGLGLLVAGCQPQVQQDSPTLTERDLIFGPYVSAVSPSGAKVHWIAPAGVKGSCRLLGDTSDAAVKVETSAITGRKEIRHTATITGLAPDRWHRYEVGSGGERVEGSFRTPPAAGSKEAFHFVITGDTQSKPLRIRAVAEAIAGEAPAFIVHTGDYCNNTADWNQLEAQFFEPWRDLLHRTPVWPARGNHEYGIQPFADIFARSPTQPWYSFDYANLHVVILDQWNLEDSDEMEPERMTAMAEWLDRDLAAVKGRADWIIVAGHQQMFNVAGHGSTWGHEQILPVLYKHGVDLVVSGHSHLYERFVPIGPPDAKPIHFLVSGGAGGPNYPSVPSPILVRSHAAPHYCLYHIEGDRLDLTVRGSSGTVIDTMTLTKTGGSLSPNIMAAAITPEDAMRLLKIYKGLGVNVTERPVAGRAMICTLSPRRFPAGSKVTVGTDPGSPWAVEEATFIAPEEEPQSAAAEPTATNENEDGQEENRPAPWLLRAKPPADVLLGGHGFSPELSVAIRLEYKGRTWFCPSVPVGLHEESVRRLAPQPVVVDVPPAPAVVMTQRSSSGGIVLDGGLDDWKDVPFLRLPSTGTASRTMKLAWTPEAIYGAVVVEQGAIHVDGELPWNADSLEINLEPDALRRLNMPSRGPTAKLFFWPEPGSDGGKASYKRQGGRLPGGSVQAVWQKTPTGYTMEFRISARALTVRRAGAARPEAGAPPHETPLAAGRTVGLDLILRHDGEVIERLADTRGLRSTWGSPIYWGQIRLSGQ
ncbi:MAG: metallophosphoesterase [Planctomycetes bacterium]|nr:metallophosphoesterase [Planctomycetota bacterium]